MKNSYFTLLFMFVAATMFAQFDVNIYVGDGATGFPIENAEVIFEGEIPMQTDASGNVVFSDILNGSYDFSILKNCYEPISGTIVVSSANQNIDFELSPITSAPVFVGTSNHPIIGSWVDGDITLTGASTYTKSLTEFDNVILGVDFGTYSYSFVQAGGCYPAVTGTVTVDCAGINAMSGNVALFITDLGTAITSAPVFVGTSNHPIIGSWVDGDITLTGASTYTKSLTEFDNVILGVDFGTYSYSFVQAGGCYPAVTGTVTVDCAGINAMSGNVALFLFDGGTAITSAPVFVGTSNHPIIGSWVDGDITLTGASTYTKSVTEFDNLILGVAFGTYSYSFVQAGGCYEAVTGTITVDCAGINAMSGNVLLSIFDSETGSAPVFVGTSNHPIIGSWVDGDITLIGASTYTKSLTEFDNVISGVAFGTYSYSFEQAGGCYPAVTGTVTVDCAGINAMSGNVALFLFDGGTAITSAPVFVGTSNHPIIGSWVDGDITLTGASTYTKSLTEFDNVILGVAFGTYSYSFEQAGGCYPAVTGTVTVDCAGINAMSGNVALFITDLGTAITSAPVFVGTSNHPIIGSWVDGDITLTGASTYTKSLTEFDNVILGVDFGTYSYSFVQAGGCYPAVTGTVTVDCAGINAMSGNVALFLFDGGTAITSAPVFVGTSNHPIIGSWVDGDITLTGASTYTKSVTEFDNLILGVAFGTYSYSFVQAGGCYEAVTGTITVDCAGINAMSGNVLLSIFDSETGSAPLFVGTSNHPIIGSWVDGDITLTGASTYTKSLTEFDNVILGVAFGTYSYSFEQAGGCYPAVTGTVTVDCAGINAMSGNVALYITDQGTAITSAPVFVGTSNHPIIGSWVDGDITLTGASTYTKSLTEFDNLILGVDFGTYSYSFVQAGGCYPAVTGTVTVDCAGINAMSGNVALYITDQGTAITSAPVFVGTSNHPIIGSWVDGDITLTGASTYTKSLTEFDNVILGVDFGTYSYSFVQAGGCYPAVTGTVTVDCAGINAMSGNVALFITDQGTAITSAPVFVGTSNHPIIGSWVDGDITLTGASTYTKSVTEFDNLILGVAFGTYSYSFVQAGGCYEAVTGTITVDCAGINAMSGNVLLSIFDSETGSAPLFVGTSNHPIIGSWVDGDITLTGASTYTKSLTEFDNVILGVAFGTYSYSFEQAGGCYPAVTGTVTVDCAGINAMSGNVALFITDLGTAITSAPVFVGTSNHPIIGSWVDGDITLTGASTYTKSLTEFDNVILGVDFGTYSYSFVQAGGCYPAVTGTVTVDCAGINAMSGNVALFITDLGTAITSAPLFVGTSNHPIIGSWVDGDITLTGASTYTKSLTEFDNVILGVDFGTYSYSFVQAGGCYPAVTGTVTVDCAGINAMSGNVALFLFDGGTAITSAPVFVGTSNHPIIGSWVDGDITLTGASTYTKSVTEFDNVILGVAFGTYSYSFVQAGGCYEAVTGTITVDCAGINAMSGNVLLSIFDSETGSAPVFVGTSNHPIIGSWVDGDITLTGASTYTKSLTEFDNVILGVAFGTYSYSFEQAGGCYPAVTGTVTVDCAGINAMSGNVALFITDLGTAITSAPVFVGTSNHPIIGSWVDGDITLTGASTYTKSLTEFDNVILGVDFGTYSYSFVQAGGCYPAVTGTVTVDCAGINAMSGNVALFITDLGTAITSAPVFVGTSNHPIIGSWVDGDITLTGASTYTKSLTEFDNVISGVAFGTYSYSFEQAGGCYPAVTGTVTVDCAGINAMSGNVALFLFDGGTAITSAPVFVGTSNHPIIGSWVDGDITLTGASTYTKSVTEFDNVILGVAFGTYSYSFVQAGGCYEAVTGTITVDCAGINAMSGNVLLSIFDSETGSAPVFVGTSNHPIIGSWVDGDITLTGASTYTKSLTEFDNVISGVAFGTYSYSFEQAGGCYPAVTGTVTVDCAGINAMSGNVALFLFDGGTAITSAPVFVGTSNHPIIGSWVDGDITLTGASTYTKSLTEFDNVILGVAFGTYSYSFEQAGGCYPAVTGTVTVDCAGINAMSGNVALFITDLGTAITSAPVFVGTSNHPIIGSWVDGDITLTGASTYTKSLTEFDNVILGVDFGTYSYSFVQAGGCYPAVTGTVTVDCAGINAMSGNVALFITDLGTAPVPCPCVVNEWIGNTDDWNTASNWSCGVVPTSTCNGNTDNVLIPSSTSILPVVSGTQGVGNLTINAGSSIVVNGTLQICGDVTHLGDLVDGAGNLEFIGATAQTITGTGDFNNVYVNNSGNGLTADASADLGIRVALALQNGNFTNIGSVTLRSDASNTAYLNDFDPTFVGIYIGNITMERFVPVGGTALKQRYFGTAVTGGTISGLDASYIGINGGVGTVIVDDCNAPSLTSASPYSNMFSWNPANPFTDGCDLEGWNAVDAASTIMEPIKGYSGWMVDGSVISVTGTPNTGVVTFNTDSDIPNPVAPINANGWDLLSNPYPSPINVLGLPPIYGSITLFDASAGLFSGSFIPALLSPQIASMQGFYVTNPTLQPVLGIDNSVRVASSFGPFFETEDLFSQMLEVQVHGNGFADRTYVYYADDANVTSAYDISTDCEKRNSVAGQPTIYTSNSDLRMSLNGLATSDMGQSVPMGVDHGTDGDFELVFEGITTLPANTTVYVEDLQTGVYHNTANGNYAYSALASDNGDRFVIHFVLPVALATTNVDCQGNLGNITLESTEGSAERNFVLAQGATTISTDDLANLNAQVTAGEYVLTVSDAFGGNQVYDVAITEADAIVAAMEVSSLNVQVGELVNFNNLTADVTNLEWTINGSVINGVNNATYTFDEAGTYPVLLNVSNEECADAKSVTIEVTNKTTSIINVDGNQSIKVYSVGTELVLEFVNSNSSNAVLNVNNVIGQSVYNETVYTEGTQRVNIADVKTGYYFVSLNIAGTNVSTKVLLTNR